MTLFFGEKSYIRKVDTSCEIGVQTGAMEAYIVLHSFCKKEDIKEKIIHRKFFNETY